MDDTSLIPDGSPSSMDGILRELDFFEKISGLKINFQKTKMVWTGSKNFSSEVFHHTRWKLDWNNSYFDILGVKFSINLTETIDLNYNSQTVDINRMLQQWEYRKLTPVGRLTIIKSLIIPKLNHLILSLPNPGQEYLKTLENRLYHFLWGSKIHKIQKIL